MFRRLNNSSIEETFQVFDSSSDEGAVSETEDCDLEILDLDNDNDALIRWLG